MIPGRDVRAEYVVLGWESDGDSFHPFTAMPTGRRRPEMSSNVSPAVRNAGFFAELDISGLPQRVLTIRAWGVDLAHEQVFPLDGIVGLDRGPKALH
jgi:hypothetical protein